MVLNIKNSNTHTHTHLNITSYLAKAALAQHHEEVKVRQLHAVLVAIGVEPGCGVG